MIIPQPILDGLQRKQQNCNDFTLNSSAFCFLTQFIKASFVEKLKFVFKSHNKENKEMFPLVYG